MNKFNKVYAQIISEMNNESNKKRKLRKLRKLIKEATSSITGNVIWSKMRSKGFDAFVLKGETEDDQLVYTIQPDEEDPKLLVIYTGGDPLNAGENISEPVPETEIPEEIQSLIEAAEFEVTAASIGNADDIDSYGQLNNEVSI